MSINCSPIAKEGDSISKLHELILDKFANGSAEKAEELYSYFSSKDFLFEFDDRNLENSTFIDRTDTQGEPLLIYNETAQKYYYTNRRGEQVFFPLIDQGLRRLFTYKQIDQITSQLALSYFEKTNIELDDSSFEGKQALPNLKEFVESKINQKVAELEINPLTKRKAVQVKKTLAYTDEWIKNIDSFYKRIGLNRKVDEDGETSTEFLEDNTKDPIFNMSSFERDSKENIRSDVKLKLALLKHDQFLRDKDGDVLHDSVTGKPILNKIGVDPVWNEPMFVDFDTTYSLLLKVLTNKVNRDENGKLIDLFEDYKSEIEKITQKKPYFKALLSTFNSKEKPFTEKDKNEFVQAFNLHGNNIIVTEITHKEGTKGKSDTFTHNTLEVSNSGNKASQVKTQWSNNFRKAILTKSGKFIKKLNNQGVETMSSVKIVTDVILELGEIRKLAVADISPEQLATMVNRTNEQLIKIGIETTSQGFTHFLDEGGNLTLDINKQSVNLVNAIVNIRKTLAETMTEIQALGEDVQLGDFFKNDAVFTKMAQSEAFYMVEGSDASIYSGGKSKWLYSYPSYLSTRILMWKKSPKLLQDMYDNGGEYIKGSYLLKHLLAITDEDHILTTVGRKIESTKRLEAFKLGIFTSLQEKAGKSLSNGEVSFTDYLTDHFNKVLNEDYVRTTTAADKTSDYQIKTGLMIEGFETYNTIEGVVINRKTKDILFEYFNSEFNRMREASKELKAFNNNPSELKPHYHYKNGHLETIRDNKGNIIETKIINIDKKGNYSNGLGNAFKSQTFEDLSFDSKTTNVLANQIKELIYEVDSEGDYTGYPKDFNLTDLRNIKEVRSLIDQYIASEVSNSILKAGQLMRDYKIITTDENGKTINKSIDSGTFKKYLDKAPLITVNGKQERSSNIAVLTMATDFYINSVIQNVEYSKLFSGDTAFYKNMVDYKKRIPATYTDGLQLRLRPQVTLPDGTLSKDEEFFNIAVIESVEVKAPFMQELIEMVGKDIASMYDNINAADAQAWITPERWKFLNERLGKWSSTHDSLYTKMISGNKEEYSEKELKIAAQPLKGVYFDINGKTPTYLKYSQAVLTKQMVKGTDLQKMYDKMVELNVDELITFDGIKVGSPTPTKIHDKEGNILNNFDLNVTALSNSGWKLQQDLPTKTFKETEVGSQIQKNIFAGLKFNLTNDEFILDGAQVTGETVSSKIVEVTKALSDLGMDSLNKEFGISPNGKIKNIEGFYNTLIDELVKRGGSKNIIEGLEKNIALYGMPQSAGKIMNVFASIMTKRLIKIKTNGGSFIQMSNFGFNYNEGVEQGVIYAPDARHKTNEPKLRIDPKTGRQVVQGGGVLISGSFIAKYIPNYATIDPAILFGTFNEETGLREGGMIDGRITENLVGYRIPNQGLASNDALRIVGILPEANGDTVVAYTGITTKTGSDFDVDKMYIMFPSFKSRYTSSAAMYDTAIEFINRNNITKDKMISQLLDNDVDINFEKSNAKELTNTYISYVLFNGKVGDYAAYFQEQNDAKLKEVLALDYVDSKGKSKEALQNRLIELYQSVLTNPKVIKDVMTPIDIKFIENEIVDLFKNKQEESKSFSHFDAYNDIKLKYAFSGGKAGVGQEANSVVDINRMGQLSLYNYNIGWGHTLNNEMLHTELDREFSEELSQEDLRYYLSAMNAKDKEKLKNEIEKVKIGDSLTAILNAFVDIAKDPYITRGNWVTTTTNTGNLMLRAGVHPLKVTAFIAQPIIKQYIDFQSGRESITDNSKGEIDIEFQKQLVIDNLKEVTKEVREEFPEGTFKNLDTIYSVFLNKKGVNTTNLTTELTIYSLAKDLKLPAPTSQESLLKLGNVPMLDKIVDEIRKSHLSIFTNNKKDGVNIIALPLQTLREQITMKSDVATQMAIYYKFLELQKASKIVRENVDVSKSDTSGMGKDIGTLYATANTKQYILEKEEDKVEGSLVGFKSKFDNTILGTYYNNVIEGVIKIVSANPLLFPQAAKDVQKMFNEIAHDLYETPLIGGSSKYTELATALETEFYTYKMSKFFEMSPEISNELINSFPTRFEEFKEANKDKYLVVDELLINYNNEEVSLDLTGVAMLEKLQSKEITKEEYDLYIKNNIPAKISKFIVLNNRKKSEDFEEKFTDSWKDLMTDNPQMAEDLIKYSFATTGFQMSSSQFFTYIPNEYFVKNNINKFIVRDSHHSVNQSEFLDKFYLNNSQNKKYINFVFENDITPIVKNKGVTIDGVESINIAESMKKGFIVIKPGKAKFYLQNNDIIYKLQGYTKDDNGIYVSVKSLGKKIKGINIKEYLDPFLIKHPVIEKEVLDYLAVNNKHSRERFNVDYKLEIKEEIVEQGDLINDADLSNIDVTVENEYPVRNLFNVTPIYVADKKAGAKSSIATKFIGFGDDIKNSSTQHYREQAGEFANIGTYSSEDVVFVSIPGRRGNNGTAIREQNKTIDEVRIALNAGATILTDDRQYTDNNPYNTGEIKLKKFLEVNKAEYSETIVDGNVIGVWRKPEESSQDSGFEEVAPIESIDTSIKEDLDSIIEKIEEPLNVEQGRYVTYQDKIYIVTQQNTNGTVQIYNPLLEGSSAKKSVSKENLTPLRSKASIVNHLGSSYIVTVKGTIISLTTNKKMAWTATNGLRKAIILKSEKTVEGLIARFASKIMEQYENETEETAKQQIVDLVNDRGFELAEKYLIECHS